MQKRMGATLAAAAALTIVAAIGVDVLVSACDNGSPTGPSEIPVLTVTISASGVSPAVLQAPSSGRFRVEFVNSDSQPHDVRSDPHPEHRFCSELNVGLIDPGQRKTTESLWPACFSGSTQRTYHDETRLDNPGPFEGSIQR